MVFLSFHKPYYYYDIFKFIPEDPTPWAEKQPL